MKKIRVLQFPVANSKGGITQYVLQNWKLINKSRFHFDFATMSKSLDFAGDLEKEECKIHYISCYAEQDQVQFIKEFQYMLQQGYDVVHLHTKQWKSLEIEKICKKVNIPRVIVHAHNTGIDVWDKDQRQYELRMHEQMKSVVGEDVATDFWACSRLAADFLFGGQIPKDKIVIMPNAIELDRFAFNQQIRDEYRKEYGLENCFVIGHAGRFEYQKNHEFLVDVFAFVSKVIDSARLVLLGDGRLLSEAKQKVKEYGLEEKVLFLGYRTDISNWYQVMDVFCLPSRFEGLGIVLVEAQAAGVPCVVSEVIPEEVQVAQEITRLPMDIEQWVQRIMKYTNYFERVNNQSRLSAAGYDIRHQIRVIENYYEGNKTI